MTRGARKLLIVGALSGAPWSFAVACSSSEPSDATSTTAADGSAHEGAPTADTSGDAVSSPDTGSDRDVNDGTIGVGDSGAGDGGSDGSADGGDSGGDGNAPDAQGDASDGGSRADSGGDGGTDAGDCGAPYPIFTDNNGAYCPFQVDGGSNCAQTEHCCQYGADAGIPSTCNASASGCSSPAILSGADWRCDEKNDCQAGETCCLLGTPTQEAACPVRYFGVNVSGTICRAGACGVGESVVCGVQGDCSSGTCTGMTTRGKNLGFCKP